VGALLTAVVGFLLQNVVARAAWCAVAWWMLSGLVPTIVSTIDGLVGNPLSAVPPELWWILDLTGFDIAVKLLSTAYLIRFAIRRLPI